MNLSITESLFVGAVCVLVLVASAFLNLEGISKQEDLFGKNLREVNDMKNECEKSLPRDQECVMVFDFVPVKKERPE